MKINKLDSKKYFVESILSALPQKYRNRPLVNKTLKVLKSYIPNKHYSVTTFKKYDLPKTAWRELINLLNEREILDDEEIRYVKFIEQEVLRFASFRIEQLKQSYKTISKLDEGETILQDFRQNSPRGVVNTCCYLCGRVLERHPSRKNPHYCTKEESPICFKNRKKSEAKEEREWNLLFKANNKLRKPYCAKCGKLVTFSLNKRNHFYKRLVFCSQKHKETYRKNTFRSQKKLKIFDSKTSKTNSIQS